MTFSLFCFDIDATLANAERRLREAGPEPSRTNVEQYDAWLARVQNHISLMQDMPVPGMVEMVTAISAHSPSMYLTAREEKYRVVTKAWLDMHGFPELELVMRPENNYDESGILKEKLIKLAKPLYEANNVVVVDDDGRGCIEEACKRNGWVLLKARSGGQK